MIQSSEFKLAVFFAASLLAPMLAPGESHLVNDDPAAAGPSKRATAHVMFEVVIPQALAMQVVDEQVTDGAMHRMVLSRTGRRSVARFSSCLPAEATAAAVNCTVSMP